MIHQTLTFETEFDRNEQEVKALAARHKAHIDKPGVEQVNIPEDIRATASNVHLSILGKGGNAAVKVIALALMVERERCAKIADKWVTNEQREFGCGGPSAEIRKGA